MLAPVLVRNVLGLSTETFNSSCKMIEREIKREKEEM